MGNANSGPPARPLKAKMIIEGHRSKINTTLIVKNLQKHIANEIERSSSQVTAALGLLRKVIPDMKEIEHSGDIAITRAVYHDPTAHLEEQDGDSIH